MWRRVGSEEEIEASRKPMKSVRTTQKIVGELVNFIYLAVHKIKFRKETSRFEVFMEHFPRSVESAVTTVSKERDVTCYRILRIVLTCVPVVELTKKGFFHK